MAGMILQFDFGGGPTGGQLPVTLVAVAVVVVVALVLLARRALSGVPTAAEIEATATSGTERGEHTRPYHATNRTGLVAVLMGESLARALERALVEINADGRRVVFVLRESWSIWRYLGVLLGTLLTLGLWSRLPGYLVIAERRTCDAGGACGEQRHPASGAVPPLPG